MSNFQLSEQANPNKIFLAKFSELEGGRFDPVMVLYQREVKSFNFQAQTLSDLLQSNPQYGANESGVIRKSENEPRYIRITDIDKYGLLKNNLGKTAETLENQYLLSNDDILIARSGATVGKAYIHKLQKEECFYAGYMIRFIINKNKANPDYIFYYMQLKVYKKWVNAIQRAAGQPNINAEEYKSLKIPIPSKEIQADIVAKMDKAYQEKQTKETEAQNLLDGIDIYLLNELGIDLPKEIDNSLKARIFTKKFSDISGGRFDSIFHLMSKSNKISNYDFYTVKQLANTPKGQSITKESIVNGNIPVIAGGQKSPYGHNIANYHGDVITVSASGAYAGYVWHHQLPIFASDCTVVFSRDIKVLNNKYLFEYLKSEQQYIYSLQQGAAQPHIYPKDIENLKIPLPPIKKQIQIAEHISQIREQAKQLQAEAITELEQVKQEVEVMILGGDK